MRTRILSGSKAPTARVPTPASDPAAAGAEASTLIARDLRARSDAPLVLGRYRLRRRLGTGGFATVWLAQDERLDRQVAVKILPRERVAGGRFEREARAAARLSHPGIVTLYEAAVDDEGAYLVSELVQGTTLGELLEPRFFEPHVVIGIEIVDADDRPSAFEQTPRDVEADEPGGTGQEDRFGVRHSAGPRR